MGNDVKRRYGVPDARYRTGYKWNSLPFKDYFSSDEKEKNKNVGIIFLLLGGIVFVTYLINNFKH